MNFYEFFAGGGMARAGLGPQWTCLFANDIDQMKGETYAANWGDDHLSIKDIHDVTPDELSDHADLAWASFPCQDLSLAGNGAGLGHENRTKDRTRSGTFWPFWQLMRDLNAEQRAPKLIVLENVYGALRSHGGKDFAHIVSALSGQDYRYGAVVVDAKDFLPQSRVRVFWLAVRRDLEIPPHLYADAPVKGWHPAALQEAHAGLSAEARKKWLWWTPPAPGPRAQQLSDLIEDEPTGVEWHSPAETRRLLDMMSPVNLAKVEAAMRLNRRAVGTVYRRMREESGVKQQRAEVRFDDVAGCLRTPGGGSSRQTILIVQGNDVRSRLLSPREAMRLMGLDDTYVIPDRYNDAYHVAGDGVAVPVVRHIAQHLLEPIINYNEVAAREAIAA
ncbi:DNA-cytosine methyltransferase [Burkholderia aenigmatica]|uniref:DNA cytosine methyltransferase n=1 Tax=Burkholderia aenigmatica TaxID=2015348 RepID=UPI001453AFA7|nr:DNA cytosine methyltransferase [Burkholderia aenigmatica]VWD47051.1 DNA-cytosine methyltransferase [Burkholderia aenigmatica]